MLLGKSSVVIVALIILVVGGQLKFTANLSMKPTLVDYNIRFRSSC